MDLKVKNIRISVIIFITCISVVSIFITNKISKLMTASQESSLDLNDNMNNMKTIHSHSLHTVDSKSGIISLRFHRV